VRTYVLLVAMAVNEGDTHTTFNILLTRPEIVLEEDV
jgi:hypothetical protein